VASGSSLLNTKGWNADQDKLFEAGDYLEVNGELKMVPEDVSAPQSYIEYTDTNYMPSPFDPEGWAGPSPNGTVTNVTLANPSGSSLAGECQIVSGDLVFASTTNSFNSVSGEKIYFCFIVKNINANNVFFRFQSDAGIEDQTRVSLSTLTKVSGSSDVLVTQLSDGFSLVQVERVTSSNLTNADILVYANGDGGTLYVQAAYFGKNPLAFPYALYNQFADAGEAGDYGYIGYNETIGGGLINLVSTNYDPQMIRSVNFDPSDFYILKLRVRENIDLGGGSKSMTMFFRTDTQSYAVETRTDFSLEGTISSWVARVGPDEEGFYSFEIDMSQHPEWLLNGDIKGIRFDFTNAQIGTDTDVDYITIESPELRQEYDAFWPAQLLATADIPIAPPLRKALTGGESIITSEPKGKFYLGSNDQSWDINVNGVQSMGFDFIEDVN